MNSQRITALLLLAMGLALSNNVWSAQAGLVQFVNGDVELTTAAGVTHAVHKGDPVNEGDTITSAKAASAQIKMQDGGFIAVRPDTRLKFDSFQFSGKEGEPENSFFSLFKGGFRAVTGLIGRIHKEDYHITTPVATIGIRGTDHETVMVLADNPLVAAGLAAPGAYNKVNIGETSIKTDKGEAHVRANQMGFAGGRDKMPEVTDHPNTYLFTVAPKAAPGAKMDSGKGGEQQARDTAVVDTTAQATSGASTTSTTGVGSASTLYSIAPPTVVISPTVLGIATAPFVNTDIVYDVAGTFGTPNMGIGASSNISSTSGSAFFNYNNSGCSGTCTQSETLTLSGGTSVTAGSATTGAAWGYWTGVSSATQKITTNVSTTTTTTTTPIISWITAPSSSPFYLPGVLQGTMTYNLLGGVATDGTTLGTVNSASLTVKFSSQLVDLALNATVNGLTWAVTGTGAPLSGGGNGPGHAIFDFNVSCAGCNTGSLSATIGAGYLTSGNVSGALTGNGLTGAILSYALTSVSGSSISGVAALGLSATTPINTATPYQIALSSLPIIPTNLPYPNNATYPYAVIQDTVNGTIFNPSTLVLDAAGNPVKWQQNNGNGGYNTLLNISLTSGAQTVGISGSTAMDTGTDPVSGIKWGRWSGGTISFTPVAGGTAVNANVPAGGLHWITAPSATSPVSLPVSGTYNYVLAGGTRPTDHLGNVGTLNSASLSANFSAMTVNTAVNVTVANTTFNGSATGVPILQGAVFQVGSGNNSSYGTLTCTGTCGTVNAGQAIGVFTQAGLGAGVTYGFQTGPSLGSPTTVVGGVVAFHR